MFFRINLLRNQPTHGIGEGRSGVRFPGRSNQHSVANGSPLLRRFSTAVLPRR